MTKNQETQETQETQENQSVAKDPIEEQVNNILDTSVENLSPEIRRRLNQARMGAIENKGRTSWLWKTAGSFSLVAAILVSWQLTPVSETEGLTPFAEVLQEDLEMLEELEFIYWMAEEQISAKL